MSVVQETTGTSQFADMQKAEHATIEKRRTIRSRPSIEADVPPNPDQAEATGFLVYNTNGLAFSGGGVRSAAFCLGALQSLSETPGLDKLDYLSTVSGGGYVGAALTVTHAKTGKFVFASPNDYSDLRPIGHIRNFSNYLFPRGERATLLKGLAVVLRGLTVNLALALAFALGFALLTVFAYPTRISLLEGSFLLRLFGASSGPFALTLILAVVVLLFMLGWGFWRSRTVSSGGDVRGPAVSVGSCLIAALALVAFLDAQPLLIAGLFALHGTSGALVEGSKYAITVLTPLAGVVAFFANQLSKLLRTTRSSKGMATVSARIGAKALLFFSAILLPLTFWILVLSICAAGIRDDVNHGYPLSYGIFPQSGVVHLFGRQFTVLQAYLAAFFAMILATAWFSPNANSLHRLYRDRLSKAFLFYPQSGPVAGSGDDTMAPADDFKLTEASPDRGGPYHLINAAINIEASKMANRRGRNADYFLFSANFVGSDSTGYVKTEAMQEAEPRLDLATAIAISGAAISSDMGSKSIGMLAPTLAMLNLRLGFWMHNPRFIDKKRSLPGKLGNKFYLAVEMFGLLDECSRQIYLTDGGHIENLGIYQLLKRGCRVIIAVDGEEDPAMEFSSLMTLQRYARIDLGIRIDLPWSEIAVISRAVTKAATDGESIPIKTGPHCALGVIHYPNGIEGYLLYMKSSLSGDENDYILDYKKRNPAFPHESTGDQFFTEEQFEVYRALGFHVASGFFSGKQEFAWTPRDNIKTAQEMTKAFMDAL